MNGIPRELDWVKERAACSLKRVFSDLFLSVQGDVKAANLVGKCSFEVVPESNETFTVRRSESIKSVVIFMLQEDRIVINSGSSSEEWNFTVGLNGEGRCQLRQNGQEFEQWQVRKMAMEGLFFGT